MDWATFDPRDASDSTEDPDNDGGWDCSGPTCIYIPYNNFQEFYGNTTLASATQVRSSPLLYNGEQIMEWWQLRGYLLQTDTPNDIYANYFRMYRINASDDLYAHVVFDNDVDYMVLDSTDDVDICREIGPMTGSADGAPLIGSPTLAKVNTHGVGGFDIDGDNIADGTDSTNYDTDGDWINDWLKSMTTWSMVCEGTVGHPFDTMIGPPVDHLACVRVRPLWGQTRREWVDSPYPLCPAKVLAHVA